MDPIYYPMNDYGPVMKGMVIGSLGILHVFLAQFAIGGGLLMCYMQYLAMSGKEPLARIFVDSYFKALILISFVLGALTGVGMWFISIQVSPVTIGLMVKQFHWIWAIEWTFFSLEVVAGYSFYRYSKYLNDRTRMATLVLYSVASFMSLFWINGILSWQLTPGMYDFAQNSPGNVWIGFFNPGFWPQLIFRTLVCLTLAGLAGCVVVNTMTELDREQKTKLINKCSHFLLGMALMPFVGMWFLAILPEDSRSYVLGGSAAMTQFFMIAVCASLLIGGYAVIALFRQKLYINGATATLLLALAFGATGGGEFVREGVRKPFTVRNYLYANAIDVNSVAKLRAEGSVKNDPYPLRNEASYPNSQVIQGAKVFRFQCSVCHTLDGANGLVGLTTSWSIEQQRMNISKLQQTKTFMPPFAGTPQDVEAIVQFLRWNSQGQPKEWERTDYGANRAPFEQIKSWLDEAGIDSGIHLMPKTPGAPDAGQPPAPALVPSRSNAPAPAPAPIISAPATASSKPDAAAPATQPTTQPATQPAIPATKPARKGRR